MSKSNLLILVTILSSLTLASLSHAQTAGAKPKAATTTPAPTNPANKKRIKLDYENDVVMGVYDTPDASFINSRRMIKYKELFNRRTNFIDEIESNKGLFNEYQK